MARSRLSRPVSSSWTNRYEHDNLHFDKYRAVILARNKLEKDKRLISLCDQLCTCSYQPVAISPLETDRIAHCF